MVHNWKNLPCDKKVIWRRQVSKKVPWRCHASTTLLVLTKCRIYKQIIYIYFLCNFKHYISTDIPVETLRNINHKHMCILLKPPISVHILSEVRVDFIALSSKQFFLFPYFLIDLDSLNFWT